ncbi:hypothetical protein BJX65DRAFT_315235 [Aspergillus insuetus]
MRTEQQHYGSPSRDTLLDSQRPNHSTRSMPLVATRFLQRWKYSKLRDICSSKGRPAIERLQAIFNLDKLPLPFAKKSYGRGEEWIRGVILCAWGMGMILLINIGLTVIAMLMAYTKFSNAGNIERAVIYEAKCSLTKGWQTGLHFLINVLSTAMLAASNYVMQCLCAPSRAAVDCAHMKNRWLDIGTLSIRNFSAMDRKRKVLWVVLLLSSFPIHMLFNSAVFSSITMTKFEAATIPIDLAPDEPLIDESDAKTFRNITGFHAEDIRNDLFSGSLPNLTFSECRAKTELSSGAGTGLLLFVTDRTYTYREPSWFNPSNPADVNKTLNYQYTGSRRAIAWKWDGLVFTPQHWSPRAWAIRDPNPKHPLFLEDMIDGWFPYNDFYEYYLSDPPVRGAPPDPLVMDVEILYNYIFIHNPSEDQLRHLLDNSLIWNNKTWARQLEIRIETSQETNGYIGYLEHGLHSSHCFAKQINEHCELYFNLPISLVVITCNIVKLMCMYMAARTPHKEIFLTVGDALASFLDHPDTTTKDQCLMSRSSSSGTSIRGHTKFAAVSASIPLMMINTEHAGPRGAYSQICPRNKKWYKAVSWRRWTIAIAFFLACLTCSLYGYYLLVQVRGLEDLELGSGRTGMGDTFLLGSKSVTATVLLANSPQLLASLLYYVCNGILSSMLAAAEYNDFSMHRKPLRVSWPRGLQRSTYYLSIPWRYGIPLLTISVTVHWLLSQTIFLSVVQERDANNRRVHSDANEPPTTGFSVLGMVLTLSITSAGMLVLFGIAFRPLHSRMPLAGTCSAALSAACHPPDDDMEASLKAVMWGEVPRPIGGDGSSSDNESRRSDGSCAESSCEPGADDCQPRYGHCTFTSENVISPSLDGFYR